MDRATAPRIKLKLHPKRSRSFPSKADQWKLAARNRFRLTRGKCVAWLMPASREWVNARSFRDAQGLSTCSDELDRSWQRRRSLVAMR